MDWIGRSSPVLKNQVRKRRVERKKGTYRDQGGYGLVHLLANSARFSTYTPHPESLFQVFPPPPHGQVLFPVDADNEAGAGGQAMPSQLSDTLRSPNRMSMLAITIVLNIPKNLVSSSSKFGNGVGDLAGKHWNE
jgi:hypothetical protein